MNFTTQEEKLWNFLKSHPNQVFSAEELYRQVWQEEPYGAGNVVAVHIYKLRRKIKKGAIRTIWRRGYQYEE